MTRLLAIALMIGLAACAHNPVVEAPRPTISRIAVDPTPVPTSLRHCAAQPPLLDEDAPQSALAPAYIAERAAGQDCRLKLQTVDKTLKGSGR